MYPPDIDPDDAFEYAQEAVYARRRLLKLIAHPRCNDPDHPGCVHCEPQDEEEEIKK